jgi:hypothetical protein
LMHAIVTMPLGAPSTVRADLPAAFDALVLRAMSRNPFDRFASARALGLALAPLASDSGRWLREFGAGSTDPSDAPSQHAEGSASALGAGIPSAGPVSSSVRDRTNTDDFALTRGVRRRLARSRRAPFPRIAFLALTAAAFVAAAGAYHARALSREQSGARGPEPAPAALSGRASETRDSIAPRELTTGVELEASVLQTRASVLPETPMVNRRARASTSSVPVLQVGAIQRAPRLHELPDERR